MGFGGGGGGGATGAATGGGIAGFGAGRLEQEHGLRHFPCKAQAQGVADAGRVGQAHGNGLSCDFNQGKAFFLGFFHQSGKRLADRQLLERAIDDPDGGDGWV